MHAPQITLLALYTLSLGIALAKHGQPRTDSWSFTSTAIATAIVGSVLWWGGFWG